MRKRLSGIFLFLLGGLTGGVVWHAMLLRQEEEPPFHRIWTFAWEQAVAERRAGNWRFTEDIFKRHALALSRFMSGEPPPNHKVIVSIPEKLEAPSQRELEAQEREFRVIVFYDNGHVGFGHEFIFWRSGELKGILAVPGR